MFSGFTESAEKIETRKEKILKGFQPVERKMTYEELEKAYNELRHALLENMLFQLQTEVKRTDEFLAQRESVS
jgi:hypothetical protein